MNEVNWWESWLMRKLIDEKVNWWESWLMSRSIAERVDVALWTETDRLTNIDC